MKNLVVFLLSVFWGLSAIAACPEGDFVRDKDGMKKALMYYYMCATGENDDDTQLMLARAFKKGDGVTLSFGKALLFYHLAADNGNAPAQVELSQWLLKLDETELGRETVLEHNRKMAAAFGAAGGAFKGELLHPYALLLLAAEKPEQKWYYPTTQKTDPAATTLLQNYEIDPMKKQNVIRLASLWKQRKMRETAQDVMTDEEFEKFESAVFPKVGRADAFARNQAMLDLKDAIQNYLQD